jgi:hypothetical protein
MNNRKGQAVPPIVLLVALGAAGVFYGGKALVRGAKAVKCHVTHSCNASPVNQKLSRGPS